MMLKSAFKSSVIAVGFILNHPLPAVLSCCLLALFLNEDEKVVGIFVTRSAFFSVEIDDGVRTFDVAATGSNVSSWRFRIADGTDADESLLAARLRSCDKVATDIPPRDLASSFMGAVYPGMTWDSSFPGPLLLVPDDWMTLSGTAVSQSNALNAASAARATAWRISAAPTSSWPPRVSELPLDISLSLSSLRCRVWPAAALPLTIHHHR
mmetsp:Transcript_2876/g.6398  ORF Transcript_2876/g.6398 Transcript_2876/m.6398 type:complete len:210 (-) Transcript_2876:6-635(-)